MKFRELYAVGLVVAAFTMPKPPMEPFSPRWFVFLALTAIYLVLVAAVAAWLSKPDKADPTAAEAERVSIAVYIRIVAAVARSAPGRTPPTDEVLDRLATGIMRGDHHGEEQD